MGLSRGRDAAAREIILLGALAELRTAAAGQGIEVVPLKGAALLELGLYRPGERGMSDVDLLARPQDLAALEKVLSGLGYRPMPESADAWVRPSPGAAPPAVMDLHTDLWHIKDTGALFEWGLEPGPGGLYPGFPDLFLHAAAHPLLHHGEFTRRALEDCARIARLAPGGAERFWALTSRKARLYGLRPVVWPALKRLGTLVPERALEELRPRGPEKIKAAFFEKAAARGSVLLEYLLPALYRPELVLKYAAPSKRFMLRRYGAASTAVYALRPFRLLRSLFRRA